MENRDDLLRVGVIANTHGIRGEVKVFPTTDDVRRFDDLKEVILDAGRKQITLNVQYVKYFKNMVIVKFKGIDNINDIEMYKGKDLLVTRENAVPLEEGEYYIADLIDMDVCNENDEKIGILYDVMQTGANDVYVINLDNGKEVLLPNIDECILDVDVENKKMKVHIMDGLM